MDAGLVEGTTSAEQNRAVWHTSIDAIHWMETPEALRGTLGRAASLASQPCSATKSYDALSCI